MNEKHVIQCVRRVAKNLFNKYVILAVMLCSFGLASAQNSDGKVSGTFLPASNEEASIGLSVRHTRKISLSISISINLLLLNLIP